MVALYQCLVSPTRPTQEHQGKDTAPRMKPMTHEEATQILLKWADILANDNYTIQDGFDSTGPVILIVAAQQGNVLQWLL